MCRLRQFCYCCRLRTGAIFTAMFTFTYSVALIVSGALILARTSLWVESHQKHYEDASGWVQIISGIISLIAFIFLVIAICKHRPVFIIPWYVAVFINILVHVYIVVAAIKLEYWYNLSILAFTLLFIYLWIILHSYYLLQKERYFSAA